MAGFLGSLLLVLCLWPEWVKSQQQSDGQQVKQSSPSLTVQEGGISILNCDYNNDMFDYFAWYKKYPANSPTLLISVRSNVAKKEDGRFTVFFNKSGKHFSLHIAASQPEDSAVYLCAAGARCSAHACSLYPNSERGPEAGLHASNKGIFDPISLTHSSMTGCDLKLVRTINLKEGCADKSQSIFGKLKQEEHEFRASLGYIVNFRTGIYGQNKYVCELLNKLRKLSEFPC